MNTRILKKEILKPFECNLQINVGSGLEYFYCSIVATKLNLVIGSFHQASSSWHQLFF